MDSGLTRKPAKLQVGTPNPRGDMAQARNPALAAHSPKFVRFVAAPNPRACYAAGKNKALQTAVTSQEIDHNDPFDR